MSCPCHFTSVRLCALFQIFMVLFLTGLISHPASTTIATRLKFVRGNRPKQKLESKQ